MSSLTPAERNYLRRLDASHYQSSAFVHWTFTIKDRRQGWLNSSFHAAFREALIHCCFRYHLWVPAYALMPDHLHLFMLGDSPDSDQLRATKWLRKQLNWILAEVNFALQQQGYDHVLKDRERDPFAFERTAGYVLQNPVRAGFVAKPEDWEFSGAVLPGFPELENIHSPDLYWENFWRVYSKSVVRNDG